MFPAAMTASNICCCLQSDAHTLIASGVLLSGANDSWAFYEIVQMLKCSSVLNLYITRLETGTDILF